MYKEAEQNKKNPVAININGPTKFCPSENDFSFKRCF